MKLILSQFNDVINENSQKSKNMRIDSISEVAMLFLVALAASVAAEKVKIGEVKTLDHAVITHEITCAITDNTCNAD